MAFSMSVLRTFFWMRALFSDNHLSDDNFLAWGFIGILSRPGYIPAFVFAGVPADGAEETGGIPERKTKQFSPGGMLSVNGPTKDAMRLIGD